MALRVPGPHKQCQICKKKKRPSFPKSSIKLMHGYNHDVYEALLWNSKPLGQGLKLYGRANIAIK